MPDITLCADYRECAVKTCLRNPKFHQRLNNPHQNWMYLTGTKYCPQEKYSATFKAAQERRKGAPHE